LAPGQDQASEDSYQEAGGRSHGASEDGWLHWMAPVSAPTGRSGQSG
jgi:hypothetical protein